ncbi:tetratricopeptide repeat protein [Pseudomonas sp. GM30]|uniref:tetratricopeptide repeat protein n=1 Tax=Pseudomonas sp. GM30 TaxID=1144328 RepID=UPI0005EB6446|nr:hypothetical protein [Pseudomonas sp. GM30]
MDQHKPDQGIELERLKLDEIRFRSDNRFRWITFGVTVIPIAITALQFMTSNARDDERLKLEVRKQEAELQHRVDDLHLKQSTLEQERNAARVKFLRDHIDMIMSPEPELELKLNTLVRIAFPTEADLLIPQMHAMRERLSTERQAARGSDTSSAPQVDQAKHDNPVPPLVVTSFAETTVGGQQTKSAMSEGRAYVRKNDWKNALQSFSNAVANDPGDALAWNFKAYSEFKTQQFNAALTSIGQAWKLNPTEGQTRRFVAINATKILCAQGRSSEAATFFNQSAAVLPDIVADVYGDGEFKTICLAIWRG